MTKVAVFKNRAEREFTQNNLYVKGFADTTTEAILKEHFAEFGEVTSVMIPSSSGRYGYVCFATQEAAEAAIAKLNNTAVDGSELWTVTKHLPKHQLHSEGTLQMSNQTSNLFLRGVPSSVTEERLRKAFEKYGKVTSISLRPERETAYVCFAEAKDASKAVYETTLVSPFPESSNFQCDYFKSKDERDKMTKEA